MSSNPLEDDPQRDKRIQHRAYHLWDAEGRPHGRHDEFWERARELIGMEESAGSGQLPNPATTGQDPSQAQPVEEAFLQENLGEFPGRFTDQGETEATPRAGRARHDADTPPAAPPPKPAVKAVEASPPKPSPKPKAAKQSEKPKAKPSKTKN